MDHPPRVSRPETPQSIGSQNHDSLIERGSHAGNVDVVHDVARHGIPNRSLRGGPLVVGDRVGDLL